MKKINIIIALLVMLSATLSHAQFTYGPRVSIGSTSLGGGSSSIGFQVGLFLNAELRDRIGIQPEVLFSVKNGVNKFTVDNPNGSATKLERKTSYSFTYIDIPFYGYVPLSKHITFLLGPQFSSVNKATQKTTGDGLSGTATDRVDVDSELKAKVGIAGGIDFELSSPLKFGLRFSTTGGEPFAGKSTFVGITMAYSMDW